MAQSAIAVARRRVAIVHDHQVDGVLLQPELLDGLHNPGTQRVQPVRRVTAESWAAEDLHSFYGTPYANIELTPMIGGNDTQSEVFTIPDVATICACAAQKGLAGIHFRSFERDNDCAPGAASATCNSYGKAGRLGFTTQLLSSPGQ
jgi:hypothetical protein